MGLEFALVAPILLTALLACVDVGLAVQQTIRMGGAVRAGAAYALSNPNDPAGANALIAAALGRSSNLTVTTTCQCSGAQPSLTACTQPCGTDRQMTLRATTGYSGFMFLKTATLSSDVTLRDQ